MGFSSFDDFVNEATTNGKTWHQDFSKTSSGPSVAYVLGNCYDWAVCPGSPVQNLYTTAGTALVAQTPTDVGVGGGIYHGGNVSTDTKHLVSAGIYSAITTAIPSTFLLCDTVMYYPTIDCKSTSAQTLINSNTVTFTSSSGLLGTYTNDFQNYTSVKFTNSGGALPTGLNTTDTFWLVRVSATTARFATSLANAQAGTVISYTNAGTGTHTMTVRPSRYEDGAGLRAYVVLTVQSGNSASTPVVSAFTYTRQYTGGTDTGRTLGATINFTAGGTNIPQISKILHSGVAANNYGFFLPLQAGDTGIQSVQTFTLSTAYTTATTLTAAIVIVKPLGIIPIVSAGIVGERNFMTQIPSFPRIYDNACLNILQFAGNATALNTAIYGYIDTAWG